MKLALTTLTAGAVALALTSQAHAAATVSYSLNYLGSTTANSLNGLSSVDLTSPTFETTAWHHVFEADVSNFTPDAANEFLRLMLLDVTATGKLQATDISGGNSTNAKWFANNP